jgi:hypothetical protein
VPKKHPKDLIYELASTVDTVLGAEVVRTRGTFIGGGSLEVRHGDQLYILIYEPGRGFRVGEWIPEQGIRDRFASDDFEAAAIVFWNVIGDRPAPVQPR